MCSCKLCAYLPVTVARVTEWESECPKIATIRAEPWTGQKSWVQIKWWEEHYENNLALSPSGKEQGTQWSDTSKYVCWSDVYLLMLFTDVPWGLISIIDSLVYCLACCGKQGEDCGFFSVVEGCEGAAAVRLILSVHTSMLLQFGTFCTVQCL